MNISQSAQEMLLAQKLHFALEGCGANRRVHFVERIHRKLRMERSQVQ